MFQLSDELEGVPLPTSPIARTTGPGTADAPGNLRAAPRAGVEVPVGAGPARDQTRADFLKRRAGDAGDLMGNAIVAVLRVSPVVSGDVILHMDQLFRNNDLHGPRLRPVDPRQVDQDCVFLRSTEIDVRPADAPANSPAQPPFKRGAFGRDPELVGRQREHLEIVFDPTQRLVIIDIKPHAVPFM